MHCHNILIHSFRTGSSPANVVKVDVSTNPPTFVANITLDTPESDLQTAFTDGTYVYFG